MNRKLLLISFIVSALALGANAQQSANLPTGLVKINYFHPYGITPLIEEIKNGETVLTISFDRNKYGQLYLEKVNDSTCLLLSGNPETPGDFVKGKYVFCNDSNAFEASRSNSYFFNTGFNGFHIVSGIRKDSFLYVDPSSSLYGDDFLQLNFNIFSLENNVKRGYLKQINLNKTNNFGMRFVPEEAIGGLPEGYNHIFLLNGWDVAVDDASGNLIPRASGSVSCFKAEALSDTTYADDDYEYVVINSGNDNLYAEAPASNGLSFLSAAGKATKNTVFKLEKAGVSGRKTLYTIYSFDLKRYLTDSHSLTYNDDGSIKDASYLSNLMKPMPVFLESKGVNSLFAVRNVAGGVILETPSGGLLSVDNDKAWIAYDGSYNVFQIAETDDPTANAAVSAASVWASGTTLYVSSPVSAALRVYSLTGQLVEQRRLADGVSAVALPRGMYIVKLGDRAQKVAITD